MFSHFFFVPWSVLISIGAIFIIMCLMSRITRMEEKGIGVGRDETDMLRDLHRGLQAMEERMENLEIIMKDRNRGADRPTSRVGS